MASTFAEAGKEEQHHHQQQMPQGGAPSPRAALRRSWSDNTSACGKGTSADAVPKCVCAPATHAGSFKCRLHRVNSHGRRSALPPLVPMPHQPPPAPPALSASSTVLLREAT